MDAFIVRKAVSWSRGIIAQRPEMRWGWSMEDYSEPFLYLLYLPLSRESTMHPCDVSYSALKYPPKYPLGPHGKFTIHYSFVWLADLGRTVSPQSALAITTPTKAFLVDAGPSFSPSHVAGGSPQSHEYIS